MNPQNIWWIFFVRYLLDSPQEIVLFADQDPHLELRALTVGQDYYFAIEAFNENGVSPLGEIVHIN